MNTSIRAVFFDFDGTLVFHVPDSVDLIRSFCAEIGQPLDPGTERLGRRARHRFFADPLIRERVNGLPPDGFWTHFNRLVLESIGIVGDLDGLAQQVTARLTATQFTYYCPDEGCRTLAELRTRGLALGLITNRENPSRLFQLLDQVGLRSHFDVVVASGEVGVRKPEPDIFHRALARVGVGPDESLYVGDNYWADVVGAQRAGLTPVLLDPWRLFPEAECLVLEALPALLDWLPPTAHRSGA